MTDDMPATSFSLFGGHVELYQAERGSVEWEASQLHPRLRVGLTIDLNHRRLKLLQGCWMHGQGSASQSLAATGNTRLIGYNARHVDLLARSVRSFTSNPGTDERNRSKNAVVRLARCAGARMVDFAGWSMPVQYTSIVEEHHAVRRAAGVFDVSHMGRLRFDGPDAGRFLDRVLTRRVADLPPGKIRYSLVTNEQGGVLDDILVSQLETPSERRYYLLVVNASNREKIVAWFRSLLTPADGDVEMADRTTATAMIALQGPQSLQILSRLVKIDLERMGYYTGVVTEYFDRPCTVTRTGYTGEDGFELIVRAEDAVELCTNLFVRAGKSG